MSHREDIVGGYRIGSTTERVGFDVSVTPEGISGLCRGAVRAIPMLSRIGIKRVWAGLRPGTRDGIPFICEHSEISGLYLNAGHFRNGVVMGPASARLLVDRMLGRDSFTEFAPYTL